MGKPREQLFAQRYRAELSGIAWLKTCGGLFDFLAGNNRRAPMWMQHGGLEWLFRLAQEPRRLAWRYATTNVKATAIMLAGLWRSRASLTMYPCMAVASQQGTGQRARDSAQRGASRAVGHRGSSGRVGVSRATAVEDRHNGGKQDSPARAT
jgi:hypothetical protein